MPIYAYRCTSCGHAQDVLQKLSDPVLTVCPACGQPSYVKQVTAAGFQLKGSGWYVTDFRSDGKAQKKGDDAAAGADAPAAGDAARSDKPATAGADATPAKSGEAAAAKPAEGGKAAGPAAASPSPTPSPSPSSTPAAAPPPKSTD